MNLNKKIRRRLTMNQAIQTGLPGKMPCRPGFTENVSNKRGGVDNETLYRLVCVVSVAGGTD